MRWPKKPYKCPRDGDVRYITRFAWFPRSSHTTWYWLEKVKIKQTFWDIEGDAHWDWGVVLDKH